MPTASKENSNLLCLSIGKIYRENVENWTRAELVVCCRTSLSVGVKVFFIGDRFVRLLKQMVEIYIFKQIKNLSHICLTKKIFIEIGVIVIGAF